MIDTNKQKMTLEVFLRELRMVAEYFKWQNRCGRLRGFSINESQIYCPLTAVSQALYGRQFSPGNWAEAAAVLGISPQLSTIISGAADEDFSPDEYVENVRGDLLEAIGL